MEAGSAKVGLVEAFLGALPDRARVQLDDLEGALIRIVDRAHIAWPELAVEPAPFVAHVAVGLADEAINEAIDDATLARLQIDDLALAFACGAGSGAAVAAFEHGYADDMRAILARLHAGPDLTDEIHQRVRHRLFVAEPGGQPSIRRYTGKGELLAFVRVTALRVGLDVLRARGARKEVPDDELAELSAAETPELQYLKALYRREFKLAFEAAMAGLAPRSRTVLRYAVVDRLSIDKIATIYDLHRSTIARQLNEVRRELVDRVRDELARRLRLTAGDLASILRLIVSDVDLSIERVLRSE
jgi:RNA polymerase sigma-70 factor (ECF subfamily)